MKRSSVLAAAVLAVHAVFAVRYGWQLFSLPIEAGGLFLGLLIGLPLLCAGLFFAATAAGALIGDLPPGLLAIQLVVIGLFDMFVIGAGAGSPLLLASLLGVVVALGAVLFAGIRAVGR